jgi:Ca2+-binding RTX toxin-like protein
MISAPVVRDYGTFRLEIGNTTWELIDVYFDSPDPRPARTAKTATMWVIKSDPLSAAERKQVCGSADGIVRSDPSSVSVQHAGNGASNTLFAGPQSTTFLAQGGDDVIVGGSGDDRLLGQAGDDLLIGGAGRDLLNGGPGSDTLIDTDGPTVVSGPGRDTVYVRDGRGDDTVRCGSSQDTVTADRGDRVLGRCRSVVRSGAVNQPPM